MTVLVVSTATEMTAYFIINQEDRSAVMKAYRNQFQKPICEETGFRW